MSPTSPWMGPLPSVRGCDCHVCRPDETYDEQDRRVIDTVLQHGWQVILVADAAGCSHPDQDHSHDDDHDDDDDAAAPAFAYTIGLQHRTGQPELLMSDLDPRLMHGALNRVAERVMAGLRLAPGDQLEDVLAGVPVAVAAVADDALAETVTWAGWFHRCKPAALALVWPDRAGVFAWQPGGSDTLDVQQPPRWRVPLEHTGGLAPDPPWDFPIPPDHPAISCTHVVDRGDAVLWAARQTSETPSGDWTEDWSFHCGADGHATADLRLVHLAHLVRSAPSLRRISDLALESEAWRDDVDTAWGRAPIPPGP